MSLYKESIKLSDMQSQYVRGTALRNALQLGLLFTGIGVGARGAKGLYNMVRRDLQPPQQHASMPQEMILPIEQEKESVAPTQMDPRRWLAWPSEIGKALRGETSSTGGWAFAMPMAAMAGGAGLIGGYKLTDLLLDQRRKAQIDSDVERAKQRYEEALSGQSKLGQALDQLFDLCQEKQASADIWGHIIGGGLTIGIPASILSGMVAYDLAKKRTPAELIRKARQRSQTTQYQRQPTPVYVEPSFQAPNEEELQGDPLDKAAARFLQRVKSSADTPWPPAANPVHQATTRTPETPDVRAGGQSQNPVPAIAAPFPTRPKLPEG